MAAGCAFNTSASPTPEKTGSGDVASTSSPRKGNATVFKNPTFPSETPFKTLTRTPPSSVDPTYRESDVKASAGPLAIEVKYTRTMANTRRYTPSEGNQYLLVGIKMTNNSEDAIEPYPDVPVILTLLYVVDEAQASYEPQIGLGEPIGTLEKVISLNPGESVEGEIMFELPATSGSYVLKALNPLEYSEKVEMKLDIAWTNANTK
jgi:hypothetical protein